LVAKLFTVLKKQPETTIKSTIKATAQNKPTETIADK